jgi:secondary thiamine-phosphate synthase enzyme
METLTVKTSKAKQVIDITDDVARALKKSDARIGLCHLFLVHTTAALTTADLDPGTDLDLLDACREIVPKLRYRHPHNPGHVPDHILSALIGSSLAVPVENGRPVLGTWQRIVLLEFGGPRERQIKLSLIPE